ncbi:MAG: helix-turn-helix transcriptional regulator [Pseudomonadales bacterium]
MTSLTEIGRTVQHARSLKGLTQGQLALQANVSRYTIIKLETGSATDIQFKTLVAILTALQLQLSVTDIPVSGLRVLGEK